VRGYRDPRPFELPSGHSVWMQADDDGSIVPPFRLEMDKTKITWMGGTPHSWPDQVDARNAGKYDKWLQAKRRGDNFPMTMGYFTREDIPFYYALADCFTIFDYAFCSSLTGTTPNRLYLWSGTVRESADHPARGIRRPPRPRPQLGYGLRRRSQLDHLPRTPAKPRHLMEGLPKRTLARHRI